MEAILVLLVLLFLVWKLKRANDQAFDSGQQVNADPSMYGSTHYEDECSVSRALWDPSCPLYHSLNDDGYFRDCGSSTDDYSGCSSWNSFSSGSSSWD